MLGEQSYDTSKRVSTISFKVQGRGSREVVEAVDEKSDGEVGIRWGMFYSNRLCKEVLGCDDEGVVRVSLVHYNACEFFSFFFSCAFVSLSREV